METRELIRLIFGKTDGGRDIIDECLPQFRGVADENWVKLREEKCASAHIHRVGGIAILKDFGSSDKGKDCIDVYAETHGIERRKAIFELAMQLGIDTGNGVSHCGPKIDTVSASGKLKDGERSIEYNSSPSKAELAFLAPRATKETLDLLSWHSVSRITINKGDKDVVISSTPSFPIFCREMHDPKTGEVICHKIYQPRAKADEKGRCFKFSYYPSGKNPGNYVHGLHEVLHDFNGTDKFDCVIICGGERDAIVVKSEGYYPIWLNSETKEISKSLITQLKQIAKRIIYIPDIDSTGKEMAYKNIVANPELHTAWLPDKMKERTGDQQKPCKDLRDWAEKHHEPDDFKQLLNSAKSYLFFGYGQNNKPYLNIDFMLYFLHVNGFGRIKNEVTKEYDFVHVKGKIVSKCTLEEIRDFVVTWSQTQCDSIRNLILKSRKTAIEQLKDLPTFDLNFQNATSNSQIFAFLNKQIMVTDEAIYELSKDEEVYFWEDKVCKHNVQLLPDMFDTEEYTDSEGKKSIAVIPLDDKCKLFKVLIHTSMLHWQKTEEGEELTPEEEEEEQKCLGSNMFSLGHILHRKREKARDWARVSVDSNTRPDSKVAEGGTSKSFILSDVMPAMGYEVVKITSPETNPMKDGFVFDQVTGDTDIICFEECPNSFEYDKLNSPITDSIVVNKKNKSRFTIPYHLCPKIVAVSNYPIHDFGGTAMRRMMPCLHSDYYHYASPTNGFKTSRTLRDDFGMVLMGDDYPEEDWNRDINFILQCEKFYLHAVKVLGDKMSPCMNRLLKRHDQTEFDADFDDWAQKYFSYPEHLNCFINLDTMVSNYNLSDYPRKLVRRDLKRMLKAWVNCQDGIEYNPADKCHVDKAGRLRRKDSNGKNVEVAYIAGTFEG